MNFRRHNFFSLHRLFSFGSMQRMLLISDSQKSMRSLYTDYKFVEFDCVVRDAKHL